MALAGAERRILLRGLVADGRPGQGVDAGDRGYVVMIMEEPGDDAKPPGTYRYLIEESRADGR